jgi:hypothetical protein
MMRLKKWHGAKSGQPATYPCSEHVDANWEKGAEPLHRAERTGFISEMLTFPTTLTFCGTHVLFARRPNIQRWRSGQVFNLQRRFKYAPELLV